MPVTDEDIIRDLMHRYTDDVYPSPAIAAGVATRQRQRARRHRAVSVAATGAALGTAAGVIALAPGHAARPAHAAPPAIKLTTEQRVLYRLSSAAARQPQAQGRYAVFSEKEAGCLDTNVIDSITGDLWGYQKCSNGGPSGGSPVQKHFSPTAAQFAAMPTSQAALRAALISQDDQQTERAEKSLPPGRRAVLKKLHGPPPPPSADDKVFEQATNVLWNPLVPPALRSALFKVLAATPGVTVSASARDMAGRRSVEISRTDSLSKVIFAAFENPATGGVLELMQTNPANSAIEDSPNGPNGTFISYDLVESIAHSSTVPPDPYRG